jgi:hypothetical protein
MTEKIELPKRMKCGALDSNGDPCDVDLPIVDWIPWGTKVKPVTLSHSGEHRTSNGDSFN